MISGFRVIRGICLAMAVVAVFVARPSSADTIVVFGASGAIGGLIAKEALARGHKVIGVSRNPSKLTIHDAHFRALAGDVTDLASFKSVTVGADTVIISVNGGEKDGLPENTTHARAAKIAVQAYTGVANSPYVIQIGGAMTLYGTREAILAHLPPWAPRGSGSFTMLFGHLDALQTYQASEIRWTVLTPPEQLESWSPGGAPSSAKRTGRYRISTSGWIWDANGKNTIDVADLAVAAVDEAENHHFVGEQFSIGR